MDNHKLVAVDQQLQKIYQQLNKLTWVDKIPEPLQAITIVKFDENSYSVLRAELLQLIFKYNKLVNILTEHKLNPFGNIQVEKASFDDKGSDLNILQLSYGSTIQKMEASSKDMMKIMNVNGLMEDI